MCELLFTAVDYGLRTNKSEDAIEKIVTDICIQRKVYGGFPDVCGGTVCEFTPEVVYVLSQSYLKPSEICEKIKKCPAKYRYAEDYEYVLETSRELTNKGKPSGIYKPQPNRRKHMLQDPNVGTFIQITDVHVDVMYSVCPFIFYFLFLLFIFYV